MQCNHSNTKRYDDGLLVKQKYIRSEQETRKTQDNLKEKSGKRAIETHKD